MATDDYIEDDAVSALEELEAAALSAVEGADVGGDVVVPEPLGSSWAFDFDRGRFERRGTAPARASGTAAVAQWVQTAIRVPRAGLGIYGDDFGFDDPEDSIGRTLVNVGDYVRRLREAVVLHDRIADVEILDASFDSATGVLELGRVIVFTDEGDRLDVGPATMQFD